MDKKYVFAKKEKLKSVVKIDKLFTVGRSFWIYPFGVHYRMYSEESGAACQLLISVGKHFFKHAVDRNRIKRLVRESYRLNKAALSEAVSKSGVRLDVGLVYKSKQIADFKTVSAAMRQILDRLTDIVDKNAINN